MKKILSLLLGIVLVLTLVGCHKDKTTTNKTTTETTTTTVRTTTEQKTTINPNVDPWYEDEYREIKLISASGNISGMYKEHPLLDYTIVNNNSYSYNSDVYTDIDIIVMPNGDRVEVKHTIEDFYSIYQPNIEYTTENGLIHDFVGQFIYTKVYYNPVQKKVKVDNVYINFNYYELEDNVSEDNPSNINLVKFISYNETLFYTNWFDLTGATLNILEYLEEN